MQISEDTLENDYVGNTKAGHTRTLTGIYSNPDDYGRDAYGLLHKEVCTIYYGVDEAHSGQNVIDFVEIKTTGAVLVETKPDGLKVYTPILEACSGGLVESDLSQTILFDKPIETYTERLRPTSQNQSNVETTIVDHLNGALRSVQPVQSRTGSRSTYTPFSLGNTPNIIRELIEDEESVAANGLHRPLSFNAGNLDPVTARMFAKLRLLHTTKPPKRVNITLPGFDFSIRRGSVLRPPLRSGFDGKVIVTGQSRSASGIGTENARRVQTIEARELLI